MVADRLLSKLKVIEPCAFEGTDLRQFNLPDVEQIEVYAFVSNYYYYLLRIAIPLKATSLMTREQHTDLLSSTPRLC